MSKIIFTVAALAFLVSTASAVKAGSLDCKTPCSKEQCGVQKCDMDVPYACVAGTAKGGCSNKPLAFANSSSCTACCDISSCAIKCDKCTADQCKHNSCTSKVPFLCTNGSDQGGCAASSSSWKVNPGCSSCCDTSSCPTTTAAPGGPAPTSIPLNCDQDCGSFCHSQERCPFATPYMCIAGPGKDGCSASKGAWSTPSCTSCCDVTKCPQSPCGTCSATVCANTLCSLTNPYICTGGSLNGGCSPLSTFWPQSPECSSCCNYNTCPQPDSSSNSN